MRRDLRHVGLTLIASLLLTSGLTFPTAAEDEIHESRLVQITLLAAAKTGESDLADLPANTRQAIDDIKDFLPFRSYRILDTSLVRVLVDERRARPAGTYMIGPDDSKLKIAMRVTARPESSEVLVHSFEVMPSMRDRFFALTPEQHRQVEGDEPTIAPRAELLDAGAFIATSFTAEVGKTVVVGSSRLNGGDEALIVLFTALP